MAFIYRLYWYSRLYMVWSWLYRIIYQREYSAIPVECLDTPEKVQARLNILEWRRDKFRELWDAIGSPQWVQYCLNAISRGETQPVGALDCDEFSVWAATALDKKYKPVLLNVFWQSDKKKGHNLCLYCDAGLYYCLGNWGKTGAYVSVKEVAEAVSQRDDGKLIGWAQFTPELKLISVMK